MADINDLFDCFDDTPGFENPHETKNPVVITDEGENVEKCVACERITNELVFQNCVFLFLFQWIIFGDWETWIGWGWGVRGRAKKKATHIWCGSTVRIHFRWHQYWRYRIENIGACDWNARGLYTWSGRLSRYVYTKWQNIVWFS